MDEIIIQKVEKKAKTNSHHYQITHDKGAAFGTYSQVRTAAFPIVSFPPHIVQAPRPAMPIVYSHNTAFYPNLPASQPGFILHPAHGAIGRHW